MFRNSGYDLQEISIKIDRVRHWYQIQDDIQHNIEIIFKTLDKSKYMVHESEIKFDIKFINLGKFNRQLENFTDTNILSLDRKYNLRQT